MKVQLSLIYIECMYYGEFDPGSGLTLAACLTHASRTKVFTLVADGCVTRENFPLGEE